MLDNLKQEFDKGMPVITYIKKKYGFDSVEEFEAYIKELKEKADKYDEQQK
ncbi:hypothetical protein [Vagococcus bubulae]|uniref:hypothetical protein n=1 Tax=Vagococcus bubulae TaxID=1977868 RepID=UPI001403A25F|nr:hypothetical protein [Vagococcus bubulae]